MKNLLAVTICTMLLVLGASRQALAWGSKNVSTDITIDNKTGENTTIYLKVKDKDDTTLRSIEKAIKKDEVLKLTESIPLGGTIKWQYSIGSIKARFDLEPREVQTDATMKQEVAETLTAVEKYSDTAAIEKLKSIAKDLHLDLSPIPIKKEQERLGSVWIGDPEKGVKRGFSWTLKNVEITQDGTLSFHSTTNITGATLAAASMNVPIYGSLSGRFESNSIYKVDWRAEHFEFPNTALANNPFASASSTTLNEIKSALESDKNSTLCYIEKAHVIKYLSYASTRGTKVNTSASAAYMSIFTADSSYIFDAQSTDVQTMTDQAVGEEIACVQREQVLALINMKIQPKASVFSDLFLKPNKKITPDDKAAFMSFRD